MCFYTNSQAHITNVVYNYIKLDTLKLLYSSQKFTSSAVMFTYTDRMGTIKYTVQLHEATVKVTLVVRWEYYEGNYSEHDYTFIRKYTELSLLEQDLTKVFLMLVPGCEPCLSGAKGRR